MHADLTLNLAALYGFLLVLARVSGVIAFVPIPGMAAGPAASRVVLALAMSIALYPVWPRVSMESPGIARLAGWVGTELALGLTIGVAIAFLLEGIQMAAQIIGLQAGYSYASTVDPSTQADTTTLQLMSQLFGGSLFFAFGFDRQVVHVLARSLETIPAGAYRISGPAADAVAHLGAQIFSTGVQLALPVLALLLLLEIAFAVLGRLHTQLQLMPLTFLMKMLAGLAFLAGIVRFFPAIFEKTGVLTFTTLLRLVGS